MSDKNARQPFQAIGEPTTNGMPPAPIGWESKAAFVGNRVAIACIGFLRTVLVIRMLSLPDYAVIGIVESIRYLIGTLFGFGTGDAITREGAIENDPKRKGALIATTYVNTIPVAVLICLALALIAAVADRFYDDPRLAPLLLLACAVTVLERLWLVSLSSIRVVKGPRLFLVFDSCYAFVNAALSVSLTYSFGVEGYFYAQALSALVLTVPIAFALVRSVSYPRSRAHLLSQWRSATRQLWGVSSFMYMYKTSLLIWRRLPLLICAPLASPEVLGAVTAALDLSSKVHFLHQALAPSVVPRLAQAFGRSSVVFRRLAKLELRDISLIYSAAFIIALGFWYWASEIALGQERSSSIGQFLYVALVVEATLVIANAISICVLIPAKRVSGMNLVTIAIRVSVIPVAVALLSSGMSIGFAVLLSMLITGAFAAVTYGARAYSILRTLGSEPLTHAREARSSST